MRKKGFWYWANRFFWIIVKVVIPYLAAQSVVSDGKTPIFLTIVFWWIMDELEDIKEKTNKL